MAACSTSFWSALLALLKGGINIPSPSIEYIIQHRPGAEDLYKLSNQVCSVSIPPLMKIAYVGDANTGASVLLPADAGKMYVIHGWRFFLANSAGTAATGATLYVYDYWTGVLTPVDTLAVTPNAVSSDTSRLSGLNILTLPGQPVTISTDQVPLFKSATVFYTEIRV